MALANRQKPYKALTHINLPFIEKRFRPGEMIEVSDLVEAQQTDDDIENLVSNGSLGEETDEIHVDNIIPDPGMPTIASAVAEAQRLVEQLEDSGQEIPKEVKALADLDYAAVTSHDKGESSDRGRR